ncbi:MAG: ComF family protein [Deltaproteobacteria bacterium]
MFTKLQRSLLITTIKGIIGIIFPKACVSCGRTLLDDNGYFCDKCYADISFIKSPLCKKCGAPFLSAGDDHFCGDCICKEKPFVVARAMARYDATIVKMISSFKYHRNIVAGETLARMLARHEFAGFEKEDIDIIIPVPLHAKRLRERSFNQALVLAKILSKAWKMPLCFETLIKHIDTAEQVGLHSLEREKNIKGAFMLKDRVAIVGKNVLLVDDVYTTGSTVKECAKVLNAGGAKSVAVITVARTTT